MPLPFLAPILKFGAGAIAGALGAKALPAPPQPPVSYGSPPPGTPGMGATYGPEPFEGAPDNPGDVYGATRLRWDKEAEKWVPVRTRRSRRRTMTKGQMQAFAFLRSQGVAADKAAGLVLSNIN